MFSRRTGWDRRLNRLAEAVAARRAAGRPILDLTVSNPTLAGIPYPSDAIAAALSMPGSQLYEPDPRGPLEAREAIARWYAGRGIDLDPGRLVLASSTSEAYSWLFKLLCDPGGRVLVPTPSYPLFGFLAGLESVETVPYPLAHETRWEIDPVPLEELAREGVGAIVAVNPNNPTGSYLSEYDRELLFDISLRTSAPIVCDEVFASYPLPPERPPAAGDRPAGTRRLPTLLGSDAAPVFVLDGLSKSAGLPGMKVGWIAVLGPEPFRSEALSRLELIADTYLSVSFPVQRALPRLLQLGEEVSDAIRLRTQQNLELLRAKGRGGAGGCDLLSPEGGWTAVLAAPRTRSDEAWALALLEEEGVLVQPGWFFDFHGEGHLVVSLLTPPALLVDGMERVQRLTFRG